MRYITWGEIKKQFADVPDSAILLSEDRDITVTGRDVSEWLDDDGNHYIKLN